METRYKFRVKNTKYLLFFCELEFPLIFILRTISILLSIYYYTESNNNKKYLVVVVCHHHSSSPPSLIVDSISSCIIHLLIISFMH